MKLFSVNTQSNSQSHSALTLPTQSAAAAFFVAILFVGPIGQAANFDFLAQEKTKIESVQSEKVLIKTVSNLRAIFSRYQPGLDSSSELVAPVQIGGTSERPTLKLSIRKCVLFICQTVDLDAEISIASTQGSCTKNYVMLADLRRSSALLSELYDRMQVQICYQKSADGRGTLDMKAHARQAPSFEGGIVQTQVLQMVKLQTGPIISAVQKTLQAFSVGQ